MKKQEAKIFFKIQEKVIVNNGRKKKNLRNLISSRFLRLLVSSGREIRTLDTTGMNRML